MALDKFLDPADPLWEQRVRGLESGSQVEAGAITAAKLGSEAVETAKIKTGAVTEAKLAEESVTGVKLAKSAVPAENSTKAKGEETLQALATLRKQEIVLNAKETEKKYKVTHQLGEAVLQVFCVKVSTKATVEGNKVLKWESGTKTEIEISSGTAVADKEEFIVILVA